MYTALRQRPVRVLFGAHHLEDAARQDAAELQTTRAVVATHYTRTAGPPPTDQLARMSPPPPPPPEGREGFAGFAGDRQPSEATAAVAGRVAGLPERGYGGRIAEGRRRRALEVAEAESALRRAQPTTVLSFCSPPPPHSSRFSIGMKRAGAPQMNSIGNCARRAAVSGSKSRIEDALADYRDHADEVVAAAWRSTSGVLDDIHEAERRGRTDMTWRQSDGTGLQGANGTAQSSRGAEQGSGERPGLPAGRDHPGAVGPAAYRGRQREEVCSSCCCYSCPSTCHCSCSSSSTCSCACSLSTGVL